MAGEPGYRRSHGRPAAPRPLPPRPPASALSARTARSRRRLLQNVTVSAERTLAVTVPRPPGRQPFSIVLTPSAGSGPLYAARVVTSGSGGLSAQLVSLLPVQSALTEITLPMAQNSYTAVLPLVEAASIAGVDRLRLDAEVVANSSTTTSNTRSLSSPSLSARASSGRR